MEERIIQWTKKGACNLREQARQQTWDFHICAKERDGGTEALCRAETIRLEATGLRSGT